MIGSRSRSGNSSVENRSTRISSDCAAIRPPLGRGRSKRSAPGGRCQIINGRRAIRRTRPRRPAVPAAMAASLMKSESTTEAARRLGHVDRDDNGTARRSRQAISPIPPRRSEAPVGLAGSGFSAPARAATAARPVRRRLRRTRRVQPQRRRPPRVGTADVGDCLAAAAARAPAVARASAPAGPHPRASGGSGLAQAASAFPSGSASTFISRPATGRLSYRRSAQNHSGSVANNGLCAKRRLVERAHQCRRRVRIGVARHDLAGPRCLRRGPDAGRPDYRRRRDVCRVWRNQLRNCSTTPQRFLTSLRERRSAGLDPALLQLRRRGVGIGFDSG